MLGLLLGALWLGVLWAWTGQHPGLHADALYLPDLLRSLQAGRGLGGWDLPPAPSLLPDLGLVWLSQLGSEDLVHPGTGHRAARSSARPASRSR